MLYEVSSTPPIIQFGALASMNDLSHMTSVDLIVGLKLSLYFAPLLIVELWLSRAAAAADSGFS